MGNLDPGGSAEFEPFCVLVQLQHTRYSDIFFLRLFCQQRLMSGLWVVKNQIQAAHCEESEKVLSPARFSVNAGP